MGKFVCSRRDEDTAGHLSRDVGYIEGPYVAREYSNPSRPTRRLIAGFMSDNLHFVRTICTKACYL